MLTYACRDPEVTLHKARGTRILWYAACILTIIFSLTLLVSGEEFVLEVDDSEEELDHFEDDEDEEEEEEVEEEGCLCVQHEKLVEESEEDDQNNEKYGG